MWIQHHDQQITVNNDIKDSNSPYEFMKSTKAEYIYVRMRTRDIGLHN